MTDADAALDAALDRLYGLPLDQFTAARDALAKELRTAGERETAATVKRLRKPSVAAWAVNQVARRHSDEVAAVLAATERLRKAQRRAVSGAGAGDLREAAQEQRAAVGRLVERAGVILAEAGHGGGAQLDRVAATLQAAPAATDTADLLVKGRLERDLEATGFGPLEGLTLVPGDTGEAADVTPTATEPEAPTRPAREQAAAGAAARRLEEAEAERDRLRREAEAAREEAVRAGTEAEGAERAAREAAEQARRADAEAKAAGRRADAAERAVEHARRRADEAAAAVAGARQALAAALARLEEGSP